MRGWIRRSDGCRHRTRGGGSRPDRSRTGQRPRVSLASRLAAGKLSSTRSPERDRTAGDLGVGGSTVRAIVTSTCQEAEGSSIACGHTHGVVDHPPPVVGVPNTRWNNDEPMALQVVSTPANKQGCRLSDDQRLVDRLALVFGEHQLADEIDTGFSRDARRSPRGGTGPASSWPCGGARRRWRTQGSTSHPADESSRLCSSGMPSSAPITLTGQLLGVVGCGVGAPGLDERCDERPAEFAGARLVQFHRLRPRPAGSRSRRVQLCSGGSASIGGFPWVSVSVRLRDLDDADTL